MPTIDELSPREIRNKRLDLQLDPTEPAPRANQPVTVLVSYDRALPEGVMLPLLFEVQSRHRYQRREFTRTKPGAIIFVPREGGRNLVVLREVAHNLWFGSLAIEVAGEQLEAEPAR